jgi:hypothetical protein
VLGNDFTGTLLHQEHWDKQFQPNMMVCINGI